MGRLFSFVRQPSLAPVDHERLVWLRKDGTLGSRYQCGSEWGSAAPAFLLPCNCYQWRSTTSYAAPPPLGRCMTDLGVNLRSRVTRNIPTWCTYNAVTVVARQRADQCSTLPTASAALERESRYYLCGVRAATSCWASCTKSKTPGCDVVYLPSPLTRPVTVLTLLPNGWPR
jgi:hypothetical protein